ncbi:MAG: prepilin-type N-terminal cleavage/methylation domain-containing protein [Thermodesulfobacteriota bacterium]
MLQKLNKKKNQKGFTLVELLIVIAIIGILAAIAIPQFSNYRKRAYDSSALADAKNLYTAAQAYFGDNPTGTITGIADLTAYGFVAPSKDVAVTVAGDQNSLAITAAHPQGLKSYAIAADGTITIT